MLEEQIGGRQLSQRDARRRHAERLEPAVPTRKTEHRESRHRFAAWLVERVEAHLNGGLDGRRRVCVAAERGETRQLFGEERRACSLRRDAIEDLSLAVSPSIALAIARARSPRNGAKVDLARGRLPMNRVGCSRKNSGRTRASTRRGWPAARPSACSTKPIESASAHCMSSSTMTEGSRLAIWTTKSVIASQSSSRAPRGSRPSGKASLAMRHAEQLASVAAESASLRGSSGAGQRVERAAHDFERGALGNAEQRAHDIGREPERVAAAERFAAHDHDFGRRGVGGDARQNFAAEAALADAGSAGHRDDHRCALVGAAFVGRNDLRELRFASEEGRAARALAAFALERRADHRASVAAHLEFESPARELAGGGVGENLRWIGAVREPRGTIDHFADRPREVDLAAPGGDADLAAFVGEKPPQLERASCLAAERTSRAEVSDHRVLAEGDRIGAAGLELLDNLRAAFTASHAKRNDGRKEASPLEGDGCLGGGRASGQGELAGGRVAGHGGQHIGHFARGGGAATGIGGQHRADQVIERMRHQGHEVRKARRFGRHQASQGGDCGRPDVGRAAGDQLEKRGAQRVDVGSSIEHALGFGLLGRHVGGRSDHHAGAREPHVVFERDTEVDQLGDRLLGGVVVRDEKNIGWLDIAVNHPRPMGGVEGHRDLPGHIERVFKAERSAAGSCREILSLSHSMAT